VEEIEKGEYYQARRPVAQGLLRTGDPSEHCLDVRTEEVTLLRLTLHM
jgi:hypothetical protein